MSDVPPMLKNSQPRPVTSHQTTLLGCNVEIHKQEGGYMLIIQDPHEHRVYLLPFNEEVKNSLIEQMAGVSIPRFEVPRV